MYTTIIRKILFITIFIVSLSMQAKDPVKKSNNVVTTTKNSSEEKSSIEKVDDEDVKDVFMRVKRIENILKPKKKLRKKKYTIA